jgi:NAD(P)-dependent dehydrogenase (short-subunit alcohol dehydrogenase family)
MADGMIIVTGGGRGIGAATSLKLAAAGYAVAVNYAADQAAAQAVVETIRGAGGRAEAFAGDVADPAAVAALFEIHCAKEAVRRLSTRLGGPGGAIVNVSSVAARLGGLAGGVPYATTKGAIETFTKGLANEVAREGIRVNAVAPGMTATDMSTKEMREAALAVLPMGRVGAAEEIAEGIIWLMSPAAAYATGTVLTISGGR